MRGLSVLCHESNVGDLPTPERGIDSGTSRTLLPPLCSSSLHTHSPPSASSPPSPSPPEGHDAGSDESGVGDDSVRSELNWLVTALWQLLGRALP